MRLPPSARPPTSHPSPLLLLGGLDPYRYLRAVLTALPTMTNWQVKDWTPEAWAKAQRPSRKAA